MGAWEKEVIKIGTQKGKGPKEGIEGGGAGWYILFSRDQPNLGLQLFSFLTFVGK